MLVSCGVDPDIKDCEGSSALDYAKGTDVRGVEVEGWRSDYGSAQGRVYVPLKLDCYELVRNMQQYLTRNKAPILAPLP
eukprot:745907-Hanusia_phi.AAC.1